MDHDHFKMDTLQVAIELVYQGCWFLSLDFTDAYYSLAIDPRYRKFLRFQFEGRLYEFTCCPMGLRTGSRLFTKMLKIPLAHLRENKGVTISGFLDDTILIARSPEEARKGGQLAADLPQDLGYMINKEKSVIRPTTKIEYLGFVIDSQRMVVGMTETKRLKIKELVAEACKDEIWSIRRLASIIGKVSATGPANNWSKLYTKRLEIARDEALRDNGYDYDARLWITDDCKADLLWWLDNLDTLERPISMGNPDYCIFTDASLEGWGCFDQQTGTSFGGKWNEIEKDNHINYLELLAIWFGLKCVAKDMTNCHIRIRSDNTTAVCCVQKQGSMKSIKSNDLSRQIWNFARERTLWLSAQHTPGSENNEADEKSRVFRTETEWSIQDKVFGQLCKILGTPDIDLFATRLNHKVPRFCAWQPDPEAESIDAFMSNWGEEPLCYAFPPFAIISRVLQKIMIDRAEVILVVPFWPTRPWFTRLTEMIVQLPILLPSDNRVLFLFDSEKQHPLSPKMKLMVAHCSGAPGRPEAFRTEWWKHCNGQGGNRPIDCTKEFTGNGRSFVTNGVWIPCSQMSVKL